MGAETKYEYCDSDSTYSDIYGVNWIAQTFTPQVSHSQTRIVLNVTTFNDLGGGDVVVSIKATDGEGKPTGSDLVSKAITADDMDSGLISFLFDTYNFLEVNVKYAIVIHAPGTGGAGGFLRVKRGSVAGDYADGECATSNDSGVSWTLQDYDLRFEDWGFTNNLDIESKVVSWVTSDFTTRMPIQRKSLWAVGRFWSFYSSDSGGEVRFRTSIDGINWTEPTIIGDTYGGADFCVWLENTNLLHYTLGYKGVAVGVVPFTYRMGMLKSNGTITWNAPVQTLNLNCADVVVAVDSEGYPWIAYVSDTTIGSGYPYVTKSSVKNGVWTTASGFPYKIKDAFDYNIIIVPLTEGKMFVTYAKLYGAASKLLGRLWCGEGWYDEETLSISDVDTTMMGRLSSIAIGDVVHTVFLVDSTYEIEHVIRNSDGSITEKEVNGATGNYSSPVLTVDEVTGDLYCFWALSNHIYYKKYTASTETWDTNATDWKDETTETLTRSDKISGFYSAFGNRIGVLYETKAAVPYNVKFDFLTLRGFTFASYPVEGSDFTVLMDVFKRGFKGTPNFEVTHSTLLLGDRDTTTGWYIKNYSESTIQMIIIQKESQSMALKMGYYVNLDALGLTIIPVKVYDLITDSFNRTWEVESVKPITVGDMVKYFKCDLKEMPLYG